MINSEAKVTVEEMDDAVVISIFPETKPWQRNVLAVWAVVWTMCGLLALVGMLKALSQDTLVFILVFMAFWAYFLFYAVRSIIWQRGGAEFIRLADGNFDYQRSWSQYGSVRSYDLETMKNLGSVNYSDKKFAKSYGDAFWTIGGEMIGFEYIGRKVAFGFKLNEKQAKDIIKRIEKARKKAGQSL